MAVRKEGKKWFVDIRFKGKRYRPRSPENSKAGAQAYEAVLRQKLARGESMEDVIHAAEPSPTFEQFAWRWHEEYALPNNKPTEQKRKKYILSASLVPFFGKMRVDEIRAHHIEQYKAHEVKRGITNKTIKNHLTVLNRCLATAYEWLELDGTPPKIKWMKCASYRTDYLSPDECEALLSRAEGAVREMILTALRTGMRLGELKGLQWSSIDWNRRAVIVRHSYCDVSKTLLPPKSNRERPIPLDVDVYEMLCKRKRCTGYVFLDSDGKPFHKSRAPYRLLQARKAAGLRKIGWHTLRHTFASHLVAQGVHLQAVQALLGHSSVGTTMRYTHLAPSALDDAIARLNPKTRVQKDFGQYVGSAEPRRHELKAATTNVES